MITAYLLDIIYWFILIITSPVRLLPDITLSPNLASALSTANGYISSVSFVFPVYSFISIIVIMLSIELAIIVFKLINYGIRKVPGVN